MKPKKETRISRQPTCWNYLLIANNLPYSVVEAAVSQTVTISEVVFRLISLRNNILLWVYCQCWAENHGRTQVNFITALRDNTISRSELNSWSRLPFNIISRTFQVVILFYLFSFCWFRKIMLAVDLIISRDQLVVHVYTYIIRKCLLCLFVF